MSAAGQPERSGFTGSEVYPGPRPFSAEESLLFKGRTTETTDIINLLQAYSLVVLHAQSGAGKSSLASAAIVPRLGNDRCLTARVSGGTVPDTGNIFLHNVMVSLNRPAKRLQELAPEGDGPWYLVLDQFEEIFTHYPDRWQDREPFFRAVGELVKRDSDAHVLIVIREEWLAHLDRYSPLLPDGFRIRYRLELLRDQAAREAITEPAVLSRNPALATWMKDHADELIRSLRRVSVRSETDVKHIEGEFVDPVHLQVLCRNAAEKLSGGTLSARSSQLLLDVDRVLGQFYEAGLYRAVPRARMIRQWRLRRWFERKLITPAKTRGLVYMDPKKGSTKGIPNRVVDSLERSRLVHREIRGGDSWFELAHDRLIGLGRSSPPIKLSTRDSPVTRSRY
jgi:hypothetical protein